MGGEKKITTGQRDVNTCRKRNAGEADAAICPRQTRATFPDLPGEIEKKGAPRFRTSERASLAKLNDETIHRIEGTERDSVIHNHASVNFCHAPPGNQTRHFFTSFTSSTNPQSLFPLQFYELRRHRLATKSISIQHQNVFAAFEHFSIHNFKLLVDVNKHD